MPLFRSQLAVDEAGIRHFLDIGTGISEQEIYEYLSRVALGTQRLDEVFSEEGVGTIPLFATVNLLLKFGPEEKERWEYLDQIWDAAEAAERTSLTVLPALMLRVRKRSAGRGHSG